MHTLLERLFTAAFALAVTLACALPCSALVDVSIEVDHGRRPQLFNDHMVFQRDTNAPVWGNASPGEVVTVEIASQAKVVTTGADGRWRVELDPTPAGGPYELVISGDDNTLTFTDVMFGDVWVLSGQSNMMIKRPWKGEVEAYPNARVFKRTWQDRPGGLPFDFARVMSDELGVPVGVLQRAMRGSSGLIRTWLGPHAASSSDPFVQEITATPKWGQSYQAVIEGVAGFAVKGFIWWQGASDIRRRANPGEFYSHVFPAMIESWRAAWDRGPIPFLFLQEPVGAGFQADALAPSPLPDPNAPRPAARMRQAFIQALAFENTQIIPSADLVGGLHPKDRVGYLNRIKAAVLGFVYGYDMTFAGPTYQSMSIESGNRVRISFRENTANGLYARGGPLQGFSISGDGQTFVWANAEIQGEEVVVWSDLVPTPSVVRYGYDEDYSFANLTNDAGMGAPTFTTEATPFQ